MNGKKVLMGVAMMSILIFSGNESLLAQNHGSQFKNGCVVREWEADATPSYRVRDSKECSNLDRRIDGGDGPHRGRVRQGFSNAFKDKKPKRGN
jgi:hypothetical protein